MYQVTVKRVLGLVSGSVVRARNISRDIVVALRNVAGGEVVEYTELLTTARDEQLREWWRRRRLWVQTL